MENGFVYVVVTALFFALSLEAVFAAPTLPVFVSAPASEPEPFCRDDQHAIVSLYDFASQAEIAYDATLAIQAAHDALPATGGTILFPQGGLFSLREHGHYVNITKPCIRLQGEIGAWVVSPNSEDAEVRNGRSILNGFRITGDNCVVSVNMRGPLVLWTPQSARDRLYVRNMIFKNLYNAGISINTGAFDLLDVEDVVFDTSRDLAGDPGNYSAINRGGNGEMANRVRVSRSTFRGVAGGIDVHDLNELIVTGGTRFEGVDVSAVKVTSYDGVTAEKMGLSVDRTVSFDSAPVVPSSANRHLSATGLGRKIPGTAYIGFVQVFDRVQWHGKVKNAPNFGLAFMGGAQTEASINLDESEWENCPIAIQGWQGNVSVQGARFVRANIVPNAADNLASLVFRNNRMTDSYLGITKKYAPNGARLGRLEVRGNIVSYGVDNFAPIRYVNAGIDSGYPLCFVEHNDIALYGPGNRLAISGGVTGTKVFLSGNRLMAEAGEAFEQGAYLSDYEPKVAASGYNLQFLPTLDGTTTVVNTHSSGDITYYISDSSWPQAGIGAKFNVRKTHSRHSLVVSGAAGGATINDKVAVSLIGENTKCSFTKEAANWWKAVCEGMVSWQ